MKSKKSWIKLPQESTKQFTAFSMYRDLGPDRSIQKVDQKRSGSRNLSRLKEWSRKHHWIERATAYDEYIDGLKRSRQEDEIKAMAARHAREAQLFQDKAIERLSTLDIEDLKPHEVIKFYDTAVRIERLSRGVPTESIKQENEIKEVNKDVITTEKLQKPEIRKAANKLIKKIADSQSSSDGISTHSK